MLKVYLKLRAKEDVGDTGWKKDDVFEIVNDMFDTDNGVAYCGLDKEWEILKMEIVEYKMISNN